MSAFSIIGLYQELLLTGSFRGAPFTYVSSDDEAGRRVADFLFPGQDIRSFQDLGQDDGDIVITGILTGDDYTAQADALRTAFQTPGPGLLVHPWLGTFQAIQKPGRPPKFSFKHDSLRVCTFTATLLRYQPRPSPGLDTLAGVLSAISAVKAAAIQMLAAVLAPAALVLGAVSQVEALAGQMQSIFGALLPPSSAPQTASAAAIPLSLLGTISSAPLDATYAGTVATLFQGPSRAIATTSTPAIPAAVAPGGVTVPPTPVDGRITSSMLLTAVQQLGTATLTGAPIQIPPGPSLILCGQVFILADAVSAAESIGFTSQQEAMKWRDTITAAIDAATLAAANLGATLPTAAAYLWQQLIGLRAAWLADMNTDIGTLPPVVTFTPPHAAPVWVLAQYLAGDTPGAVINTYRDLIRRNGIFHPATPPPGPLEVLA